MTRPLSILPALALAVILVLSTLSVPANAAPFGVRLSYTGDTTTSMSITWNTPVDTATEVHYGLSSGATTETVTGTSNLAPDTLGWVHEVTLHDLLPDTTYTYIAGSTTDGFSAEHTLTTGPPPDELCGSFTFAFAGDNRPDPIFGGGENWPQILEETAARHPAFILNGGDLVTNGDNYDGWVDFLNWSEAVASNIPLMTAIGNHDDGPGEGDGATYNKLFALPRSEGTFGSGTEDYYYFTYGNAIFASLSTESFTGGASPLADQAAWLDEVLTDNPRKWKFVMYHKPTYTQETIFGLSHSSNEAGQNPALVPVFDAHHVDIVLTSHNHWYERYEPSACASLGDPGSTEPCSVGASNYAQGTVYVVSGGAGAFTVPEWLAADTPHRVSGSDSHHYLLINVDNETLTYEVWSAFPQDSELIDSFTITKEADSCTGLDECPDDPAKTSPGLCGCGISDVDTDADGAADCADDCPDNPDKSDTGQCGCDEADTDTDGDGSADCVDQCPNDATRTVPGACGCGTVGDGPDSDGDGVGDCVDACPNDPDKVAEGACGCGTSDADTDGDGTSDCADDCPDDSAKQTVGACGCGVAEGTCAGDCPDDPDKSEPGQCGCGVPDDDGDSDGAADCKDGCPGDAAKVRPGLCGCGTPDTDSDSDGRPDCKDGCPNDPNKTVPGADGCGGTGAAQTGSTGTASDSCGCGTLHRPQGSRGALMALLVTLVAAIAMRGRRG